MRSCSGLDCPTGLSPFRGRIVVGIVLGVDAKSTAWTKRESLVVLRLLRVGVFSRGIGTRTRTTGATGG